MGTGTWEIKEPRVKQVKTQRIKLLKEIVQHQHHPLERMEVLENQSQRGTKLMLVLKIQKKKRKSLINRLSGAKTKTKTAQDIKAKQEQAAKKREEALNEKKEKAAEETDKLALAQEKATSDKAKKAKAKAEKEHVVAAVIKVDIEKDGTKEPKKGMIQRLSGSKKPVSSSKLKSDEKKAAEAREAATQAKVEKAGAESTKVENAKDRYSSEKAEADRKRAEKSKAAAVVISVDTEKNYSNKAKSGLVERISRTSETTAEDIEEKHSRARESREEIIKEKVATAAAETKKIENGIATYDDEQRVKDRERTQKSTAAAVVISVFTDKDHSVKPKKGLIKRISGDKPAVDKEQIDARINKARESREEKIQEKVATAAAEGEKVEKGKETYNTEKAEKDREQTKKTEPSAIVISVWTDQDPTVVPKKGLIERISAEKTHDEEKIAERHNKARESREEIMKEKVATAAAEGEKVEKGKETYKTEKAEKDRQQTKKTEPASVVITVWADKDPTVVPKKGLLKRLSAEKTHDEAKIAEKHNQARESYDEIVQKKVSKAANESKKVEESKARAETTEAKNAKKKAVTESAAATVISVSTDKDPKKQPKKGLVKRLSQEKKKQTSEELKAAQDKADANRDNQLKDKTSKATAESQKVEAAKIKAATDSAQADKEQAEKEAPLFQSSKRNF